MINKFKSWFPNLKYDKDFKITSPNTRDYNCISWALGRLNVWYWPPLGKEQEEDEYWPEDVSDDTKIETFIKAMKTEGFALCSSEELESSVTKIALYSKDGYCTHAARQLPNGLWTSKLGFWHDIQHSSPLSLEGDMYGSVYCFMKKLQKQMSMTVN